MGASSEITNRNYLSPTGFKFTLQRCPGASFFATEASIPDMELGVALQTTYLKDIPVPGDKIEYGDLTLKFLIDEDLKNYMEIHNWIEGLGYPRSLNELAKLDKQALNYGIYRNDGEKIYSDGTLQILTNNLVPNFQVFFRELFPYYLSTLTFDATVTDVQYMTAEVRFKYMIYTIQDLNGDPLYAYKS